MSRDHTPHRIASLQPSATVILSALGQLDRVVACTRYCVDVCPEASSGRTVVADSWTASAAEILAVKPDLVIAAVPYQEKALAEILKTGARFLGLAPKTLSDIYTDIATIAGTVACSARGEEIISHMQQEIEAVRRKPRENHRPRVFCEEWGKPLIASQPWVAELVEAAGGIFVGEPGKQIDPATVAAHDPDILVAAWCGAGDRVPLEKIVRERGWANLPAVLDRRVYCIRDEFLNTPAPTLLAGLRALASAIDSDSLPGAPGLRRIA
jgi:iron complex transport system substrate-binding protein